MGFFWTKDRHKYKQASGPFSLTDEEKTQEARGHRYTFVFTVCLYSSAPEIFTENTIRKRSCLGNIPKFIQTVYMISSK